MMSTQSGGCHCGAVRFEVVADLASTVSCNCSICAKTGSILTFVPMDRFHLSKGEDHLTNYQFNTKKIHHLFCNICGIRSFGRGQMPDGTPMVAINVRCLDEVDLSALTPTAFDGKSL